MKARIVTVEEQDLLLRVRELRHFKVNERIDRDPTLLVCVVEGGANLNYVETLRVW